MFTMFPVVLLGHFLQLWKFYWNRIHILHGGQRKIEKANKSFSKTKITIAVWVNQSVLKWPRLRMAFPCNLLSWSALLWLAILLSRLRAKERRPAAAVTPATGPITSSLFSNSFACALTPATDRVRLRKEVVMASSASSDLSWPLFPFWGPATLTLETARWCINEWRSSEASPKAPMTRPFTSPKEASLVSTGPVVPWSEPQYCKMQNFAVTGRR